MKAFPVLLRRETAFILATELWLACPIVGLGGDIDPVRVGGYDTSGLASGVAVLGHYAYVADGTNGLLVIDISNPTIPRRVAGYEGGGWAMRVAVSGNFAYVADWTNGLEVLDISNPNNPRRVGGCEVSGHAADVAVTGNHACVADELGLEVIDVSNPSSPQRVGRYEGLPIEAVEASGHYAYVAGGWNQGNSYGQGLLVIDISNPANPQRVGGYSTYTWSYGVAVSGSHAYLAGGIWDEQAWLYRDGLVIIDISNPANPQRVGGWDTAGSAVGVAVSGDCAYVLDSNAGLLVIDISEPANPRRVGKYGLSGWAGWVAVSGKHAYVTEGYSGLEVIDISHPANPQWLGGFPTAGPVTGVAVSGSNAYVAESWWSDGTNWHSGGLHVIDVSHLTDPQRLGGYDTGEGLSGVAVSGGYACVTTDYGPSSLLMIDVSNPANPQCVGAVTNIAVGPVVVSGSHAYMAAGSLQVVDISDPAHPQRVGSYHAGGHVADVAVSGNYAYVAEWGWYDGTNLHSGGLRVIDVASPANPQRVGIHDIREGAQGVALSGQYACVAAAEAGLLMIDVSEPTNPQRVGSCDPGGRAYGVKVSGHHAYVVDWGVGLHVIDISDPINPRRVGGNSSFDPTRVAVRDAQVFLTTDKNGLVIAEMMPFFKLVSHQGQLLKLSWEGFGPARLLRSTQLTNPDWRELPGHEATNAATLPISSGPDFFRLVKP